MVDKIKIGEYIRTKKGIIAKVCAYQELRFYDENRVGAIFYSFYTDKGEIADVDVSKHKIDIMDLIEVGDVLKLKDEEEDFVFCVGIARENETLTYQELIDKIKSSEVKLLSIVTKEQFNEVEYEVETTK